MWVYMIDIQLRQNTIAPVVMMQNIKKHTKMYKQSGTHWNTHYVYYVQV